MMPGIKRQSCVGMSCGDKGIDLPGYGTNTSNNFKNVVPVNTIEDNLIINDDLALVNTLGYDGRGFDKFCQGDKISGESGEKERILEPHDLSIRLRDQGNSGANCREIGGVLTRADGDLAGIEIQKEIKVIEHVVQCTQVKDSGHNRGQSKITVSSGDSGKSWDLVLGRRGGRLLQNNGGVMLSSKKLLLLLGMNCPAIFLGVRFDLRVVLLVPTTSTGSGASDGRHCGDSSQGVCWLFACSLVVGNVTELCH
jgi:hypothetical protein